MDEFEIREQLLAKLILQAQAVGRADAYRDRDLAAWDLERRGYLERIKELEMENDDLVAIYNMSKATDGREHG